MTSSWRAISVSNSASVALFWVFRLIEMNTVRPRPERCGAGQRHVALDHADCSSTLTRARHGDGDKPMRRASSALVSDPSRCSSSRMRKSLRSSFMAILSANFAAYSAEFKSYKHDTLAAHAARMKHKVERTMNAIAIPFSSPPIPAGRGNRRMARRLSVAGRRRRPRTRAPDPGRTGRLARTQGIGWQPELNTPYVNTDRGPGPAAVSRATWPSRSGSAR